MELIYKKTFEVLDYQIELIRISSDSEFRVYIGARTLGVFDKLKQAKKFYKKLIKLTEKKENLIKKYSKI